MFLSELEISGFKSFANKTKFKFSSGITAIVGPNGCGKSNVVDAVRWVLGEQKTSILRSDTMESVIFNGTSARNSLGMAEVTMRLENNKSILPSEYDSVQITRRLFRDGNSNYLLNKTKCRLKDINDLFMDTGLGPDSYSVIELKMVEALINGKVDERRRMIEEAAGVTRYKLRRKETSLKLNKVQEDLERINDIVSEVETNVKKLQKQAKKTKKYNELSENLKQIETKLIKNEYAILKQNNDSIKEKLENLNNQLAELETLLENIDKEIIAVREEKSVYDSKISELNKEENALNNQIAESNRIIAVNKEKKLSLSDINKRLLEDNSNSTDLIDKLNIEITTLNDKFSKRETEAELQTQTLTALKEARTLRKNDLDKAKELANADLDILNKLKTSIQSSYSIIENNEKRIEKINQKVDNYTEEISIESKEIDRHKELLTSLNNNLKTLSSELSDKNENFNISKIKLDNINSDINVLNESISELKNNLSSKKSQLEFLESLTADDDTTQVLLKSNEWEKPEAITLLEELISTENKYSNAISSVLGVYKNLIVVETTKQAESAFELLKKKNLPKRAVVCKELIPNGIRTKSKLKSLQLIDVIEADSEIINLVYSLFGDVAIADTQSEALEIAISNKCSSVSLDGFFVTPNGILRGGGTSKAETTNLGKQKRIADLNRQIKSLELEYEKLQANREALQKNKNEIDLDKLSQEIKKLEAEIKQLENSKLQSSMKIDTFNNNIEMYQKSIDTSKTELHDLQNENSLLQSDIFTKKETLKGAEANKEDKMSLLKEAEINFSKSNEELQAAEILIVQIKSDINNIKNEIQRSNSQLNAERNRVESRKEQIIHNEKSIIEIGSSNSELTIKLDELNSKLIEVSNTKLQAEDKQKSINEKQINLSNDVNVKRNEYNKLKDIFHKEDIVRSELETKIETLENRAFEAYDIHLSIIKLTIDESFQIEESKKEVADLKSKLINLGNINFEAVAEYDEQSERLSFLTKQIKDLIESEKTLKETIKEINITVEERFETTFNQIKKNFSQLFKKLFGDDAFADINLVGDSLLESGIEITAKPAGKKPRSIDMLSGGEKTLTAIALLFAIYLVKPSPFCILDEVDAPLDDANLKRFSNLIQEFSANTQFIIVTHMKITMEAANVLYGITQQEVGISKIVSVKLQKDEIA